MALFGMNQYLLLGRIDLDGRAQCQSTRPDDGCGYLQKYDCLFQGLVNVLDHGKSGVRGIQGQT